MEHKSTGSPPSLLQAESISTSPGRGDLSADSLPAVASLSTQAPKPAPQLDQPAGLQPSDVQRSPAARSPTGSPGSLSLAVRRQKVGALTDPAETVYQNQKSELVGSRQADIANDLKDTYGIAALDRTSTKEAIEQALDACCQALSNRSNLLNEQRSSSSVTDLVQYLQHHDARSSRTPMSAPGLKKSIVDGTCFDTLRTPRRPLQHLAARPHHNVWLHGSRCPGIK